MLFTAPYSPNLNPIEYMFSKYKAMLKRYHNDEWRIYHMKALTSVTPADAGSSWFQHCHVPGCEHFPCAWALNHDGKENKEETIVILAGVATMIVVLGKRKRWQVDS